MTMTQQEKAMLGVDRREWAARRVPCVCAYVCAGGWVCVCMREGCMYVHISMF